MFSQANSNLENEGNMLEYTVRSKISDNRLGSFFNDGFFGEASLVSAFVMWCTENQINPEFAYFELR
jgi:hypothetical protein